MIQENLFTWKPARFDGSDYIPNRDDKRLTGQIQDIFTLMKDGKWRTLEDIGYQTGHPEASVSAQLRHLRKQRFGSHSIEKRYLGNGLYQYRLVVNNGK